MIRSTRLVSATASVTVSGLILAAFGVIGVPGAAVHRDVSVLKMVEFAAPRGAEAMVDEGAEAKVPSPATPISTIAAETVPAAMMQVSVTPPPATIPALTQPSVETPPLSVATQAIATDGGRASVAPAPTVAVSSAKGVADGLDVAVPAGTSLSYAAKVRSWLLAHQIYPKYARLRRLEGIVHMRFVLDRAGHVLERRLVQSSGHVVLDDESLAMIARADPFPAASRDIAGERIEFTAPIEFLMPGGRRL